MIMGSRMLRQGRLGQLSSCQGSSVLLQSVAQCSPCLDNVHLWAVTTWVLVDHSCLLVKWSLVVQVHQHLLEGSVARSRYEHLAELGYIGWTQRDAGSMELLLWLLVGPLVNPAGGDWILCTSSHSHVVMGTHSTSGLCQCVSSPCPCLAHMCKSCPLGSSAALFVRG